MRGFGFGVVSVLAAALAFGEIVHWRASHRGVREPREGVTSEAVVVLGYKNAGVRVNRVNRYRTRAGIRSIDGAAERSTLVFCGGAVAGEVSEAELMARFARDELGFAGTIALDCESRTTWENIENAIPLIEHADSIKIVSNSLHAEKGRAYLRKLRPDLAERLSRAEDYRFGELIWLKPFAGALGLRNIRAATT